MAVASGLRTKHIALIFLVLLGVNQVGGQTQNKMSVQLTTKDNPNQQVTSLSPGCVPGDWCPKGNGWHDTSGSSEKQCCNDGAFITCKGVDNSQSRCQAPGWESLGRYQCCTTQWAHCESNTEEQYCNGGGWMFAFATPQGGNKECCTTSVDYEPEATCYKGYSWNDCYGNYKYLGQDKCCEINTCIKLGGSNGAFCKGDGWVLNGKGKCCSSGDVQCKEGVESAACTRSGWKYFGNKKCCTATPQEYCISLKGSDGMLCERNGWTDKGKGTCCITTSRKKKITCKDGYSWGRCYGGKFFGTLSGGKCCWEEELSASFAQLNTPSFVV